MHSSRSLRRPSLFALSLSITLSFSLSISSLSFSLPPTFLVSSSCISLPLSPSFFLFQRSCICFSPPLGITLFLSLSLSRDPSFLLHRIHLPRRTNDPVSFSRYVHPLVPSLFFSFSLSLSVPSRLSFPGLVHALFSSLCPAGLSFRLYRSLLPLPPRGFSFADVYISRQVGMQGRTSYAATCECVRARVGARNTPIPPTMYLSLWSRVLPWLVPLGSAYIGNIVCTCQV